MGMAQVTSRFLTVLLYRDFRPLICAMTGGRGGRTLWNATWKGKSQRTKEEGPGYNMSSSSYPNHFTLRSPSKSIGRSRTG